MRLILENVRCFTGRHEIPIKPLTLLIGENSSGKSTFLATLSAVCDPSSFPMQPRFNEPPYNLGSYDTVATYKGGKFGRAKCFSLGHISPFGSEADTIEVTAIYRSNQGQVQLSEFAITSPIGNLILKIEEIDNRKYEGQLFFLTEEESEKIDFSIGTELGEPMRLNFFRSLLFYVYEEQTKKEAKPKVDWFRRALRMSSSISPTTAFSIAPIRTKPKRTYDQVTEGFNPEGDDIPFLLARILNESATSKQKKALVSALQRYGEESGLFKTVGVKKLGDKISDPFQVLITVAGRPANLLDVGYGISQALPVVVHSVLLAEDRLLLLQQPEVHLHPKAQAALGSFFIDLVVEGDKRFVIETHSDYIVDRVRQEVAVGRIKAESVGILFFERNGIETIPHQLELDKSGNIINAPPCYRDFFLQEELNLLNRTALNVFDH